nr:hypothetical protein A4A49_31918 [Ipomoea trifida]
MRAFKKWMSWKGVEWSDALELVATESSVFVRAVCDLHEGDLVAKIPKESCLTIKTCGARQMIEEAELDGYLGLAVALMYERSLGPVSPWFGYLQLLPHSEPIPLLWSLSEINSLLAGTELHKIIKEDKVLIHEDWKECIQPLLDNASLGLNPEGFGIEEYFAARSLISSRSFQIDDYHGFGMVPLADLFNHKTGAEDVHFTSISSDSESDSDADDNNNNTEYENNSDHEPISENPHSGDSLSGSDLDSSSMSGNDPTALEMIMVKNVKAGVEVFNTYGYIGNAALLHRYGFTEPDNRGVHLDSHTVTVGGEEAYSEVHLAVSTMGDVEKSWQLFLSKQGVPLENGSELSKNSLLTESVCLALLSLADSRESLYGSNSLKKDIKELNRCSQLSEPKQYHSLVLRISERKILQKLRTYASAGATTKKGTKRKGKRSHMKSQDAAR